MQNAIITKITVGEANQDLPINVVVSFLRNNPQAELLIRVSEQHCVYKSQRYNWILDLQDKLYNKGLLNRLCFFICGNWASQILQQCKIPKELLRILQNNAGSARLQLGFGEMSQEQLDCLDPTYLAMFIAYMWGGYDAEIAFNATSKSQNFIKKLLDPQCYTAANTMYGSAEIFLHYAKQLELIYRCNTYEQEQQDYCIMFPQFKCGFGDAFNARNIIDELPKIDAALNQSTPMRLVVTNNIRRKEHGSIDLKKAQELINKVLSINENENIITKE